MNTKTITIERVFDAPIEKVWDAWTNPDQIKKWWGPKDWTAPAAKIDFRVGGTYLYCMRGKMSPDAPEQDSWSGGVFKEIVPMQKIVATDYFADAEGTKVDPKEYDMPGEWPEEMVVTVTFEDLGNGKTKLTLVHEGHPADLADMAEMGWNQSLDKFAAAL